MVHGDWEKVDMNHAEKMLRQEHEDEELQWFVKMQNPSKSSATITVASSTRSVKVGGGSKVEVIDKTSVHESRSRSKHKTAHFA